MTEKRRSRPRLAAPQGLCRDCIFARQIESERSVFLRCAAVEILPGLPRYPALPVWACPGYKKIEPPVGQSGYREESE